MKLIAVTLPLFLIVQISGLAANEQTESQQVEIIFENIQVKPSQIFFCENEIFVLVDNAWTRVDSLKSETGTLVASQGYWVCPRCLKRNELGTKDCRHCPYSLPY